MDESVAGPAGSIQAIDRGSVPQNMFWSSCPQPCHCCQGASRE